MSNCDAGDDRGDGNFQEIGPGLCQLDSGRVDIDFGEHKPWLASLAKRVERASQQHEAAAAAAAAEAEAESNADKPAETPSPAPEFPLKLNIVIQVVGSRGDVQPFMVLGKELRRHGHRVRLATHLAFRQDVLAQGLEFFNIGGDPEQLMAFMVQNPSLLPGMRTIRSGAIQRRRKEMKQIFSGCWRSCYELGDGTGEVNVSDAQSGTESFVADAIIANPPSFAHLSCAEKLGIPLHIMFPMPWSPTQAFPHPLANIQGRNTKPTVANFASYTVVEVLTWEGLGDLINKFRKKELGLEPLDATRASSRAHRLRIPHTYLWSPSLLPKPKDWDDTIDVCGFQFLSAESNYKPPPDLEAFLADGPRPIYIGFGSIVVEKPENLTEILFSAVQLTGQRALISKGWSKIGSGRSDIPDNIFLLDASPHDWLFKHVSCVVHHGGAGTTAAGLLAGLPTVIIPFFGDQPFWGSIVARAGAGPEPIPFKKLTAETLASAITRALNPEIREKASSIGENMRMEKGAENAVSSFHRHLDVESLRCSICPTRPAVWWLRHSHVKLSTFAASVLLHTGHINPRDIMLYQSQEHDTYRQPIGPLSALAEVLYDMGTGIALGAARVPGHLAGLFSGEQKAQVNHEYRGRDWALQHFAAEWRSYQQQRTATDAHPPDTVRESSDSPERESEEHGHGAIAERVITANENRVYMEKLQTGSRPGTARRVLAESQYRMEMLALYTANYILLLPTDLSLSICRGFHNMPKLYSDHTVQPIPRVKGYKGGLRAAKKEFTQGFYFGARGLVVLPSDGLKQSGGKGLMKGIGKGIGGAFFKPAAGICGLVGFPLQGVHRDISRSLSRSKSKQIIRFRITQGIEEMCNASVGEKERVIQGWHDITGK
ncbi:hypothetical protein BDV18DRAFT_114470 [Aspergillus unguis]